MFKGLKTKLAEESKRISTATANAVSTGLESFASASASSRHSEGGDSETGASERRDVLLDLGPASPPSGLSANSSALMEGFDDTPKRTRRSSGGSLASLDSAFSFSFPSAPTHRLGAIPSDTESIATDLESNAGSNFISGASKEQISSVLHKLQGRASTYKDKYRDLVKQYNEVVRENEKCRTVLTTTQDKALRRIEQLREEKTLLEKSKRDLFERMEGQDRSILTLRSAVQDAADGKTPNLDVLERTPPAGAEALELANLREKSEKLEKLLTKCKSVIQEKNEKLASLKTEKETWQASQDALNEEKAARIIQEHQQGSAGMGELAAERVAGEWRRRLESAETEWGGKLRSCEEASAMALAQAKSDMHAELERRDGRIAALAQQLKVAEEKVAEESATGVSLEEEKTELVAQMSKVKTDAVRLLKPPRDEAEAETEKAALSEEHKVALAARDAEWEGKVAQLSQEADARLAEAEKQWKSKLRETEEQMALAVEEREMQKAAALTSLDAKSDSLHDQLQQLNTEKLELAGQLERVRESAEAERSRLCAELAASSGASAQLASALAHKSAKEVELAALTERLEEAQAAANQLKQELEAGVLQAANEMTSTKQRLAEAEAQLADMKRDADSARESIQAQVVRLQNELTTAKQALDEAGSETAKQLEAAKEELKMSKSAAEQLTNDLNSSVSAASEKEQKIAELTQQLGEQCAKAEAELARVQSEAAAREQETRQRLDTLMESQNLQASDYAKEIEAQKNAEIERLEGEKAALSTELASHKATGETLESRLTSAQDDLTQRTAAVDKLERDLEEEKIHRATNQEHFDATSSEQSSELDRLRRSLGEIQTGLTEPLAQFQEQVREAAFPADAVATAADELKATLEEGTTDGERLKDVWSSVLRSSYLVLVAANNQCEELSKQNKLHEDAIRLFESQQHGSSKQAEHLASEKAAAETQLAEMRHQNEQLTSSLQQLQSEKAAMEAKLAESAQEMKQVAKLSEFAVQEKNFQISELTELLGGLEEAVDTYRTTLGEREAERKATRLRLESESRRSHFESTESQAQVAEMGSRVDELEEAVEVYRKTFSENKGQIKAMSQEVQAKESEVLGVKNALSSLLRDNFFALHEKDHIIDTERLRVDELEEALEDYKKQYATLQADLKKMKADSSGANDQVGSLSLSIAHLEAEKGGLADKVSEMEKRLQDAAKESELTLKEKNFQLSEVEDLMGGLEEAVATCKSTLAEREKESTENQHRVQQINSHVNELEEAVHVYRGTLVEKKDEAKDSEVKAVKNALTSLLRDNLLAINEKDHTLDTERLRISELEGTLEDYKKQYSALKSDHKQLAVDSSEAKSALESLQASVESSGSAAASEVAELKSKQDAALAALQGQLGEKKTELETAEASMKAAEAQRDAEKTAAEAKIADYKKKAETRLSQIKTKLEKEREAALGGLEAQLATLRAAQGESATAAGELERRLGEEKAAVEARLSSSEAEAAELRKELETLRAEATTGAAADADSDARLTAMAEEHNEKVKTLARELQAEMDKKDADWQAEYDDVTSKADEERNRLVKEYQREVKDLYKDLNERTLKVQQLQTELTDQIAAKEREVEELKTQVASLGSRSVGASGELAAERRRMKDETTALHQEWSNRSREPGSAGGTESSTQPQELERQIAEEVPALQEEVRRLQSELGSMRAYHKEEMDALMTRSGVANNNQSAHSPAQQKSVAPLGSLHSVSLESHGPRSPLYDEPTEFEYLRNVLYRYMMERETLGKESVTLARVISTVLRFDGQKASEVLAKEESRLSAWYPA